MLGRDRSRIDRHIPGDGIDGRPPRQRNQPAQRRVLKPLPTKPAPVPPAGPQDSKEGGEWTNASVGASLRITGCRAIAGFSLRRDTNEIHIDNPNGRMITVSGKVRG